MDSLVLRDWPPTLSKDQLDDLTLQATSYAFSTGLLYLPPTQPQPPIPTSAIHAPLSLFPSPFPRSLFQLAQRLQRIYNILYSRIAQDEEFLDRVMGTENGVGKVDDFIGQLWTGWKQLRDEGLVQPLQLGLYRSDYLVHTTPEQPPSLKQVEFNTISVSFASLSERTAALHRYLYASTHYYNASPHLREENFPANNSITGLVDGLAAAHKAYNNPQSHILFVVQPGERNVFDQRPLEYKLLEQHSIHVIRRTFDELGYSATVDPETHALRVSCSPALHPSGFVEISTVYFRSGYTPTEYPTPAHYATRFLLERSRAIKCPSIALQLAGGKKIQEVLTQPGVLERFLCDERRWGKSVFTAHELQELRESFMGMWGLDVAEDLLTPDHNAIGSGKENYGVRKARECFHSLVLKPQREGGGNNIYKESIPPFLDALPPKERQAWIAMELIVPPEGAGNYLLRAGGADQAAVKVDVVSELGIFGWALFGDPNEEVKENQEGWLTDKVYLYQNYHYQCGQHLLAAVNNISPKGDPSGPQFVLPAHTKTPR
ncbi:Glutathione synthetase [Hypsizygus marmoreus]|uniref:Glutathione synthetase n=1 Tax=Hypsizygus marmoreus TaxID=39966 RepID=A0A369IY25_HYPMA|nr:Glutathione synthetase [Hypsizygus marmoreus]